MSHRLYIANCLDVLKETASHSIDSLITDPPAGISFMGKSWDSDKGGRDQWIAWMTEVMSECLRVLKPGGHGLVWALPRTSHWTATALENAGFEVRDVITHLFGSGFPKSMDISKAIDKQAGATPIATDQFKRASIPFKESYSEESKRIEITAPATPEAKRWAGWGTALKPASEHWILVRKPLDQKTVAANVLKHGTGGINIDGCRIEAGTDLKPVFSGAKGNKQAAYGDGTVFGNSEKYESVVSPLGRFPANLLLDEVAAELLDEQSGISTSVGGDGYKNSIFAGGKKTGGHGLGDTGGASRFFYVAKASKKDKGADNTHPTVKSTKLMEYLIKLITPPNGVVLDPFMGSGSTGVGADRLGFSFIGIEQDATYFKIAEKRIPGLTIVH